MVTSRRSVLQVAAASSLLKTARATARPQPLSRQELFRAFVVPTEAARELTFQFNFTEDVDWDGTGPNRHHREGSLFGIDVSHHNGAVDWPSIVSEEVLFAYAKTTQGTDYVDQSYKGNWMKLASQRTYAGSYHFLSSDGSGHAQAQHFLSHAAFPTPNSTMPSSLDLEWDVRLDASGKVIRDSSGRSRDFWDRRSPTYILTEARAWLDAVAQSQHKAPIVYVNAAWWSERIKDASKIGLLAPYKIWIADYSVKALKPEKPLTPNDTPWTIWQFTSSGWFSKPSLRNTVVDTSVYKGSLGDFRKTFDLT